MAQLNDFTILRFYKDDNPSPSVPLARLAEMEQPIVDLARTVMESFGIQSVRGSIDVVASPQQGCLEIYIAPAFALPSLDVIASISGEAAQLILKGIKDYGEPTKFIWEFIFGPCSVVGLWTLMKQKEGELKPASPTQEVIYKLSQTAVENPSVVQSLRQLSAAAQASGADKVTIEISGGPELTLWDAASRRRRGLIASRAQERAAVTFDPPRFARLARQDQPVFEVDLGGKKMKSFICTIDGKMALALWQSNKPVPGWGEFDVKGNFIDPDQVDPDGRLVDEQLEAVSGVFLVSGLVSAD